MTNDKAVIVLATMKKKLAESVYELKYFKDGQPYRSRNDEALDALLNLISEEVYADIEDEVDWVKEEDIHKLYEVWRNKKASEIPAEPKTEGAV